MTATEVVPPEKSSAGDIIMTRESGGLYQAMKDTELCDTNKFPKHTVYICPYLYIVYIESSFRYAPMPTRIQQK